MGKAVILRPLKVTAVIWFLAKRRLVPELRSSTVISEGPNSTRRALMISVAVSRPKKRPAVSRIVLTARLLFLVFIITISTDYKSPVSICLKIFVYKVCTLFFRSFVSIYRSRILN